MNVTASRAKELLTYCPDTGALTWKQDRRSGFGGKLNVRAGDMAGFIGASGYRIVRADGKNYRAHRLIWLIQTGDWPECEIDHINGRRSDNRWANIRPASRLENAKNLGVPKNNTSGAKGVSWSGSKSLWRADIMADRKTHFLGFYPSKEEAARVYSLAAQELHGEFRRAA